MSGAMENRAAVFASEPQDVEVYRDGAWWPASLLGWRHDGDGSCEVWVRTSTGETEWTDLAALRLPEPPGATGTEPPATVAEDVTGLSELTATMNLFAVRDLVGDDDGAGRPADRSVAVPSGGRRRAPEGPWEESQPEGSGSAARSAITGRHRAPAVASVGAGRHRAADTGVWSGLAAHVTALEECADALEAGGAAGLRVSAWGDSLDSIGSSSGRGGPADVDGDAEADLACYTRPLRMDPQLPRPRRPRWDDPFDGNSASGL